MTDKELDYPEAVRVVQLYLKDFCDKSLKPPDEIAEAARRVSKELQLTTDTNKQLNSELRRYNIKIKQLKKNLDKLYELTEKIDFMLR